MLAAFTGYEIIAKVPVILHTPLMSGSNFVHGIVLVGAMVALGMPRHHRADHRLPRRGARRGQRGRRLRGHRAHARDVQVQRGAQVMEDLSFTLLINSTYFVAVILFIVGLKRMSSPRTARGGMVWAGWGMVLATLVTFLYFWDDRTGPTISLIVLGIGVGGGIAWWTGKKVAMTDMPQMIALYNGMGGGAAGAIAAVDALQGHAGSLTIGFLAVLGGLIGAVAFSGSLIAFAKLQGWMRSRCASRRPPGQRGAAARHARASACSCSATTPRTRAGVAVLPAGAAARRR
jgi:hypothetical protein